MDAPNTRQLEIASASTDIRLKRDQRGHSLEFFPNRVWSLQTIPPPPRVQLADLRFGELAYLNVKRTAHSRLRSSLSTFSKGTVCPRSHCAIDSRSIRSVSASTSNVSSASCRRTVTDAPSGSSTSSSSMRPSMIRPEATRICAFYRLRSNKSEYSSYEERGALKRAGPTNWDHRAYVLPAPMLRSLPCDAYRDALRAQTSFVMRQRCSER
jgi:hypothetical protein